MKEFKIRQPDMAIGAALQAKIDQLAKPQGSLGRLEELAQQIGIIQQTLTPALCHPHHVLFAADHGIAAEGVSPSPTSITYQQAINMMQGGAGINVFLRQQGFTFYLVDAGVDYDFDPVLGILDRKIRKGTRNFLYEAAMTTSEMEQALEMGAQIVQKCHEKGCNIISFGELGIANTSASSLWMSLAADIPLKDCVGAGSGWKSYGVERKYAILQRALDGYFLDESVLSIMRYFGGYEMVMAVGGMLQAAELGMIILIDGFIMSSCFLMASKLYPECRHYAVFAHQGEESGHQRLLAVLQANPLLNLGFRLGEGTGALCAYSLLDASVRMLNEMCTFAEGGIAPIAPC